MTDFNLDDYLTERTSPGIKWLNIVGYHKAGKTKMLMELAKHIDTLYVDFDVASGTKPYVGTKIVQVQLEGSPPNASSRVLSLIEFIQQVVPNMKQMGKRILVLDPINKFVDMIKEQLMIQYNIDDLSNYKLQGVGNGWTVLYSKVQEYFSKFFASFDLVITVTHLKLDKYFIGESIATQGAKLDLPGKSMQYVQSNADAHLVFTSKKDENGKYVTLVNEDNNGLINIPLGCRDYKFLRRIETGDDLIREIGKFFGKEIDISAIEPGEIVM